MPGLTGEGNACPACAPPLPQGERVFVRCLCSGNACSASTPPLPQPPRDERRVMPHGRKSAFAVEASAESPRSLSRPGQTRPVGFCLDRHERTVASASARWAGRASRFLLAGVVAPLSLNTALLGDAPGLFCAATTGRARVACMREVETGATRIVGDPEIVRRTPLPDGGAEWPNRERISAVERIEVALTMERGGHLLPKRVAIIRFSHHPRGGENETCVFPLAHWQWSSESSPQRFAAAPRGICGARALDLTDLLEADLGGQGGRSPSAIRFLSCAEAAAWRARDAGLLARAGTWNPEHPWAKFFFLDSLSFWRGEGRQARADYACAVRIPALSLRRLKALSASGDAWLSIYDDGRRIELTTVTRAGVEALLTAPIEILEDAAPPTAPSPRLRPHH